MRRINIFILLITCSIQMHSQVFDEFECLYQADSTLIPADLDANCENGRYLTPKGTLRVLIIFAQINYDQNPNNDPGSSQWDENELPDWKDELFDPYWSSSNLQGKITRYYAECSFGEYQVLGDYLDTIITINESSYGGGNYTYWEAALQVLIEANTISGGLLTNSMFTIEDFDLLEDCNQEGAIKNNFPDDPFSYDHLMIIFRNHQYLLGGRGAARETSFDSTLYNYYCDTRSVFGGSTGIPFNILHHEYDHMLFGSNNFHAGGGRGDTKAYFIGLQGGWSMMGGASSSFLTCNGWDRDRLGYRHPRKTKTISALDGTGNNEVSTDLNASQMSGIHEYILRDFVTYGDVIRIMLPNIPSNKYPQWLWIENHQTILNNGSEFDKFQYQNDPCIEDAMPGLYAYIQNGKNIKQGDSTYTYSLHHQEYLRFINAEGYIDMDHEDDSIQNTCLNNGWYYPFNKNQLKSNAFTGSYDQEKTSYDLNDNDTIYGTEGKENAIEYINGNFEYHFPFFGDGNDAFTMEGKNYINMGTNPSTCNMLTSTGNFNAPLPKDHRTIYLNNVSIEITGNEYGNIKVQINFNNSDVTEDARWCGEEIVLPAVLDSSMYSLNITDSAIITLDWGETATRRTNPIIVDNEKRFNYQTILKCIAGSVLHIDQYSGLELEDSSAIVIDNESLLEIETNAILHVKNGSTLVLLDGSTLKVQGNGKVIIENGSYICIEEGARIELTDDESYMELKDGWISGINPNINLEHNPDCSEICTIAFSGNGKIIDESYVSYYEDFIVDGSLNWDSVQINFLGDLIIENGGSLLLLNSGLGFSKNSKIIIERGGLLVNNGSTLSGLLPCKNNMWPGIQVWGNLKASQYTIPGQPSAQGKLVVKNGAVIENAAIAADLWKPGDYSMTGGIIDAEDANFRNNAKSVHALHYRNYNPAYPEYELDYFANFRNCNFIIDSAYPGSYEFYKHVDLDHVRGIKFYGCDFSLSPEADNVSEWNNGIAAYDAGIDVMPVCTNNTIPCSAYDSCRFSGFYSAIHATSDGSTSPAVFINKAQFTNNTFGVHIDAVYKAVVLLSRFYITTNRSSDKSSCAGAPGAGIYAANSTGFAFEENYFTKMPGSPPGIYIGIWINNTQNQDEVYKNYFHGLSYANYADGRNWNQRDIYKGLAYLCNENTGNFADFFVEQNERSGIQSNQGSEEQVTGNKFSPDAVIHFFNGGVHQVDYYYCNYCQNENPDDQKIFYVTEHAKNFNNPCPSHYGGGSSEDIVLTSQQREDAELAFSDNLMDYENVQALYFDLVDGGDTEDELQDIQNAQPDDMWALRAQLLGDSPHLSMEVLKEASDRTDVFTESAVFDIVAANPDELKKEELISYLEEKEDPLPDYMIEILRQVASGITYKSVLQQQMALYNQNKTRAANDIIRSILNDSIIDQNELRDWLDNLGGIGADQQIITSYMLDSNFTAAFTLANMIPQLYDLDENELAEHEYYMDLLDLHHSLYQEGRNMHQLDSAEIENLSIIADSSRSIAGAQARNILEAAYGAHFYCCPELNDTSAYKSGVIVPDLLNKVSGMEISVKPNPAGQWAAFDYNLPENVSNATLTITNVTGKTIEVIYLEGQQGQKLWDTRMMEAGVYFYTLESAGLNMSGKIIICK